MFFKDKFIIVAIIITCSVRSISAEDDDENNVTCTNYREYDGVNVTLLEGSWKASELILHLEDRGVEEYKSCPVINITFSDREEKPRRIFRPSTEASLYHHRAVFQTNWYREYRHLKLLWDESGIDVEYSLYFKNDSVGFWNSLGEQTGSLSESSAYKQFTGTVQVLKAVGDHLLLHFCQAPINGNQAQLFTVLLSREPRKLQRWEIESAHALLRRKNLSVTTRRLVCGNGSEKLLLTAATLVLSVVSTLLRL